MKFFLNLFTLVLFSLTISIAQPKPPAPPKAPGIQMETSTTCSSKTKININMDGGQKFKFRSDDHDLDMDLDFEKKETRDIHKLLTKYLGQPTHSSRGTEEWTNQDKSYRIRLQKGNLDASFDKDELSSDEFEKLLSFTRAIFEELGWEVDLDI